jgi:hypothetical protein
MSGEPVLALLCHRKSVKLDCLPWSVQRRRIDHDKRAVARPVVVAAQTAVMETKHPVSSSGQEKVEASNVLRFDVSQVN